jgi:hypothetical protein
MAKHMPDDAPPGLKIGLASDGVLFAAGELDGYRQVSFFSDHLRSLGYREHLLGSDDGNVRLRHAVLRGSAAASAGSRTTIPRSSARRRSNSGRSAADMTIGAHPGV